MEQNRLRFSGLEWFNKIKTLNILVVGAGGIGSWTTLLLSRMSPYLLSVVDNDTVDETNLGGQLYRDEDIMFSKTMALKNIVQSFSQYNVDTYRNSIQELSKFFISSFDIVINATDNMLARKHLYDYLPYNTYFIDGRMEAETYQIFTIKDGTTHDLYKNYLFNDDEVPEQSCSTKATSHCAASIASLIVAIVVNIASNLAVGDDNYREVPFFITKNLDLLHETLHIATPKTVDFPQHVNYI